MDRTEKSQIASNRFLVTDDQTGIRQLIQRILVGLGAEVVEAADGDSALELFRTSAKIDAAIIDLTMPAMDGLTLAALLREIDPQLPIVLMSGFDIDDVLATRPAMNPPLSYLEKPFRIAQLTEAIDVAEKSVAASKEVR